MTSTPQTSKWPEPESNLPAYSYKNTQGIKARYITNIQAANFAVSQLSREQPVGFDLEWKPIFRKGQPENPVAVVQIANATTILIIQVSAMGGSFPQELRAFIQDPGIIKVGAGIQGDAKKLEKDFGVCSRNCVDLSLLAKSVDNARWKGRYTDSIGLARLVEYYEKERLTKGKITRSNWEDALSPSQQEYAANDAHAGIVIYNRLLTLLPLVPIQPQLEYYTFNYVRGRYCTPGFEDLDDEEFFTWTPVNPEYDPGPPPPPRQPPPKASDILDANGAAVEADPSVKQVAKDSVQHPQQQKSASNKRSSFNRPPQQSSSNRPPPQQSSFNRPPAQQSSFNRPPQQAKYHTKSQYPDPYIVVPENTQKPANRRGPRKRNLLVAAVDAA